MASTTIFNGIEFDQTTRNQWDTKEGPFFMTVSRYGVNDWQAVIQDNKDIVAIYNGAPSGDKAVQGATKGARDTYLKRIADSKALLAKLQSISGF